MTNLLIVDTAWSRYWLDCVSYYYNVMIMWYNVYMIPIEFKPFLWSYDFDKLDKEKNKNIVISAILDYGTYNTWPLLFNLYNKKEIIDILESSHNNWNKKSYNFWHQILN